mmetsp:Transcript_3213/g.15047  ORF Transcript_3213/g.15047 Transcript_3213/m.15047 type:complete len:155 (+) Transcript_3213:3078-3542(+)
MRVKAVSSLLRPIPSPLQYLTDLDRAGIRLGTPFQSLPSCARRASVLGRDVRGLPSRNGFACGYENFGLENPKKTWNLTEFQEFGPLLIGNELVVIGRRFSIVDCSSLWRIHPLGEGTFETTSFRPPPRRSSSTFEEEKAGEGEEAESLCSEAS